MSAGDHRAAIARIDPVRRAALSTRSDLRGLAHLALYLFLLCLTSTAIVWGGTLGVLALLPHGILLVFLFTLQHEATHQTPFASVWLNEAVGRLIGLIIFQPFLWFRYFHLAHHRHTNDPERDPELLAGPKPESRKAFLWHVSGLPLWHASARQIISSAFGGRPGAYVPKGAVRAIRREARVMLAIYTGLIGVLIYWPLLIWLWLLPLVLAQPFLRLYLLAEHGRCAFVADMLSNTRTTFTNRIVRFLAWNMPYHIEHHSLPNVPFHKLPALHEMMHDDLKETATGYNDFTMIYWNGLER